MPKTGFILILKLFETDFSSFIVYPIKTVIFQME